jgi:cobalt-zinc-cadmium efflux system membrane fusion protein
MSAPAPPTLSRRLAGLVPTVLALAGIAAVGAWGMSTGWKLPKLGGAPEAKADWCAAHNVPEDVCVECRPDLMPRPEPFGWCRTHGVHECPLCHPEVAQLHRPFAVSEADRARAAAALAFAPRPDNGRKDKLHERRIQFTSIEAFDRSGVEVSAAFQGPIAETAPVHGEITHDPGRVAHVSSRAAGTVWKVYRHLGEPVKEGDLLALVDAAAVGQAKADYLQALAQLDVRTKTRAQMDPAVVPAPTITTADAAVREARIKLAGSRQALINLGLPVAADDFKGLSDDEVVGRVHFLGLPPDEARYLDPKTTSNNLLPIRSPITGTVTSRDVVAGEVVDPARMLFEVVDNSTVWLTVGVRNEDVSKVRVGRTRVRFEPDGHAGEVEGPVAWVSSEADHKTRTVKVRVNLPNPDGRLRANTFGRGHLVLREEPNAILVPSEAIHVEGGNHYLFVRDRDFRKEGRPKVFHTRTVRVGARDARHTEVIAGVLPGELVATRNSTMLMAELLRGKIGEG